MQEELIVKHNMFSLLCVAIPVCNPSTVWYVTTSDIQPLGRIVARVQSHSDSYDAGVPCNFRFCMVEQSRCDTLPPELRKDI